MYSTSAVTEQAGLGKSSIFRPSEHTIMGRSGSGDHCPYEAASSVGHLVLARDSCASIRHAPPFIATTSLNRPRFIPSLVMSPKLVFAQLDNQDGFKADFKISNVASRPIIFRVKSTWLDVEPCMGSLEAKSSRTLQVKTKTVDISIFKEAQLEIEVGWQPYQGMDSFWIALYWDEVRSDAPNVERYVVKGFTLEPPAKRPWRESVVITKNVQFQETEVDLFTANFNIMNKTINTLLYKVNSSNTSVHFSSQFGSIEPLEVQDIKISIDCEANQVIDIIERLEVQTEIVELKCLDSAKSASVDEILKCLAIAKKTFMEVYVRDDFHIYGWSESEQSEYADGEGRSCFSDEVECSSFTSDGSQDSTPKAGIIAQFVKKCGNILRGLKKMF